MDSLQTQIDQLDPLDSMKEVGQVMHRTIEALWLHKPFAQNELTELKAKLENSKHRTLENMTDPTLKSLFTFDNQ